MVTSIDGRVTGEFLSSSTAQSACELYYELNRRYKEKGAKGFICGRVTMEGSFTGGWYPDLSKYEHRSNEKDLKTDFVPCEMTGFYAVAFDSHGKLGWKSNRIVDPDGDPGYDGAQIIEILSKETDDRYLAYLRDMKIPYFFAGEKEIDVELALSKLKNLIGVDTILLEGGGMINGSFMKADCVDEVSLVVAPVIADRDDKSLFHNFNGDIPLFKLEKAEKVNDNLVLNYVRK